MRPWSARNPKSKSERFQRFARPRKPGAGGEGAFSRFKKNLRDTSSDVTMEDKEREREIRSSRVECLKEENARFRLDRHPLFRATDQGEFSSALKSRVLLSIPGQRSFHNKWGEGEDLSSFFRPPRTGKLSEPRRIVRESRNILSLFFYVRLSLTYGRLSQGCGQWGAR